MKKKIIISVVIAVVILLAAFTGYVSTRKVTNIQVTGNEYYTDDEIKKIIFDGKWDKNPYVLRYKSKYGKVKDIPFVDKYKIEILNNENVKVTIYEKKIIGYVSYMGSYMYFDKDGTVVESSADKLEGIPEVTGFDFETIVMDEDLPVKNKKVFETILEVTQAIQKYDLTVDKIYIDDLAVITVTIGDIEAELGENTDMDDKVRTLRDMLESLSGRKGTLDLSEYSQENSGYTTFKEKK